MPSRPKSLGVVHTEGEKRFTVANRRGYAMFALCEHPVSFEAP